MKNKKLLIVICMIIVVLVIVVSVVLLNSKNKNSDVENNEINNNIDNENQEISETIVDNKVDVIDINSNTRPYAVVVNNTDVAVKVQEGLNKAYLVYEIPTEGNTSRLLALYKDIKEDLVIGTIRSARHNFVDFALESDAIFCCFGWSIYAENDIKAGSIDYLQGLYGGPYYRNNSEGLAVEHTAYTSIARLNNEVNSQGMRNTSSSSILLNYNVVDTDLSLAQNSKVANTVKIPYGAAPQIASFKYNDENKMYTRYENDQVCIDHNTKEEVTTKNIIVQKIGYSMCDNNYYWDLRTTGSGDGYYITNGHAVEIEWKKENRTSKTKYTYKSGTIINGQDVGGSEISVSDGRTWIEVQTTIQPLTIE